MPNYIFDISIKEVFTFIQQGIHYNPIVNQYDMVITITLVVVVSTVRYLRCLFLDVCRMDVILNSKRILSRVHHMVVTRLDRHHVVFAFGCSCCHDELC